MGDSNLYGGQFFYNKSAGSANGFADVDMQLIRNLSTESGYYFDAHSIYTGFKQVNELAGGGTLFQQTWDNSLGFKWIKRFEGGYSLKPRVGFTDELFRETNDERWTTGLYDYVRYEGGVALERKTRWSLSVPWTYQFSYDFYYTHYPHLTSLASQFGSALAAPNPGSHVLDTVTNQLTYRSDFDLPGFASVWGMYSMALVGYTDAKVVNEQDQYLDSPRSDAYQTLSAGYSKRLADLESFGRVRPVVGLGVAVNDLISNQNNFDTDPSRLQFIADDFSYWEVHLMPSLETTFLTPMISVRVAYDAAYRSYVGRLTQNANGSYNSSRLQQVMHNVLLEAGYPLTRGLDLKVRAIYGAWSSNTHFQQSYVYDYTSWNYFAGIDWKL